MNLEDLNLGQLYAMRDTCLRWLCRNDSVRSSFVCFDGGEECQGYWPANEQPTTPTK